MNDDVPDDVKAQLEADQLVFGTGFAEYDEAADEYRRLDPTEVTLSTDSTGSEPTLRTPHEKVAADDWQGEMKLTFEAEDHVRCPSCGLKNPVPSKGVLRMVSKGPLPCRLCGHPLL